MQVRDLIAELQRFDASATVKIKYSGTARHPSGVEVHFGGEEDIDRVKPEAGEPVIVAL
jgi:hypothetical protein